MINSDLPTNKDSLQSQDQWQIKKLRNVISLEYGTGLTESQRIYGDFPVYGSNGQVGKNGAFLVNGPGIVVGRKGSIGKILWSSEPFWPIDTTYYVKVNGNYDLRWCYWLLLSLPLDQLDSSTGIPGLNRNDAYELLIKVPPNTDEQRRIAQILDTIDAQIQETEQLITKLKQMKAGLLHDLLTRGIDEHGEMRDPVAHPEQFKDSVLERIPREWAISELFSICVKVTDGCHQSVETATDGVPFLYVSCIRDGQIFWDQGAKISEDTYKLISKGREPNKDLILYTVVGSYGNAALVEDERPFSFQRHIAYILPDITKIKPKFLLYWLNSSWCRS